MLLLQFSTSPYCRKVRLALGYKGIPCQVENLTPGLHVLKLKPLTGGLRTVPVLLPQLKGQPEAIADSTQIFHSIESRLLCRCCPQKRGKQADVVTIEDWLVETIGIATRFVGGSVSRQRPQANLPVCLERVSDSTSASWVRD